VILPDLAVPDNREEFIKKIDILEPTKMVYDKPIAIIYNPNSGKKRNIRGIIA